MSGQQEEEREAIIVLQVDDVTVNEVKGQSRTKLDQGTLTIIKIDATNEELAELGGGLTTDSSQLTHQVTFFIVNEHKLPVIKAVPVIRKEPLKYTFLMRGLMLEIALPIDTDPEEVEVLEIVLRENGVFRAKGETRSVETGTVSVDTTGERVTGPQTSYGDKISSGIGYVGQKLVSGMQTATPVVQNGIQKSSNYAKDNLTPNEEPSQIKHKKALKDANMATKTAVIVSGQFANAMVGLAKAVGGKLGSMAGNTSTGQYLENNRHANEAKKVAQQGITTTVEVIDQATESLKAILTSTCSGVSDVVQHKYGNEAGEACRDGLGSVENVVHAGMNLRKVGMKGLAKAVGKEAAKEAVKPSQTSQV